MLSTARTRRDGLPVNMVRGIWVVRHTSLFGINCLAWLLVATDRPLLMIRSRMGTVVARLASLRLVLKSKVMMWMLLVCSIAWEAAVLARTLMRLARSGTVAKPGPAMGPSCSAGGRTTGESERWWFVALARRSAVAEGCLRLVGWRW